LSSSSRPCDGVATSASGQARVGAREDGVWMCVKRVRKRTGLGKMKRKNEKKMKNEKSKKKEETWTYWEPIYRLHGTGSSMPAVPPWVEGRGRSCANHRPCAEAMGGHAWVMHAIWVQVVVVVKTSRWHGNLIFWPGKGGGARGWYLGACREGAQTHRMGKKKKKVKKK